MIKLQSRLTWACAALLMFASPAAASNLFEFEDIEFWTGSGLNEAAILIDWDDSSSIDESLAWGYRWDGMATGADMFLAAVEADDRLFAKVGMDGQNGLVVYGIGYDEDNDGYFQTSPASNFNSNGIAWTGPSDFRNRCRSAGPLQGRLVFQRLLALRQERGESL